MFRLLVKVAIAWSRYTQNFALMALNEAAMAAGVGSESGRRYMQAADKLSSFLVRAQVSSLPSHPYLHGTWLRGFDVSGITIS